VTACTLAAALGLAVLSGGLARAQTNQPAAVRSVSPHLVWNEAWPRVRAWEYIATGSSYVGVLALELSGRPIQANWTGNFLFDFAARDAFGTRDASALSIWKTVGDIPFYSAMVFPAVDALLVAGAIRGNWDVAWQMIAMDLEAFALAVPLVYVTQYFVRRARPYTKDCGTPGGAPYGCSNSAATQSFPSGHVALVATTAGLTCAHHSRLPLYGGGAGDVMACVTWASAAVLVGVARIAMNKHYVSDVLVGLGIGALAGYAVPVLLHYAMHSGDDEDELDASAPGGPSTRATHARSGPRLMLMPLATDESLGLGAFGAF